MVNTKETDWIIKYFEEKFKNIELRFDTVEKEKILQAREYERRLNDLNHENARVLAQQDKSVSVEKFEGSIAQIYSKLEDLKKDMIPLAGYKEKQEGHGSGVKDIMDIIKLLIIIAGFFIAYFVIKK